MSARKTTPPLYNAYGRYLQEKFGERVHKVSVHAGFTCPNRDGTVGRGGCTYCNIVSFTPESARPKYSVRDQIETGIRFLEQRFAARRFLVYFQPYSNTYAPVEHLETLFRDALQHPQVVGLAIGTRPDCVDEARLAMLARLARETHITLEFGLESIYDDTLRRINRGHDFACTRAAIAQARAFGLPVTLHVILGFPNETEAQWLAMAEVINTLDVQIIKLHNLHVVKHTELARQYQQQPFHVFSYEEWVSLVIRFLERLSPAIVIERLHGETPRALLIAPRWHLSRAEIIHGITAEMRRRGTYQGRLFQPASPTTVAPDTAAGGPSHG
ncbi:MAG: TIGR01212 family radical SAM protein [candidate division KSB1 bacterium]|nr:TIGR01212 family radical SAM protein [candidate division KSB1 bacterium]MDZ7272744.1 TIGR01212 family radical SAM protein [candidate division KSB1 bacterium]MDZ7284231.1 TIGR01212 family radical SAM protein [candidate division KSB1 bacterium]MDZ7297370.1 TIGR01212 family radical SAM protein [candidate division KSB1 bacterium]MDZ7309056.1 TIGR01212 family radical SAM protein [candidate division KSB1 bacterium]